MLEWSGRWVNCVGTTVSGGQGGLVAHCRTPTYLGASPLVSSPLWPLLPRRTWAPSPTPPPTPSSTRTPRCWHCRVEPPARSHSMGRCCVHNNPRYTCRRWTTGAGGVGWWWKGCKGAWKVLDGGEGGVSGQGLPVRGCFPTPTCTFTVHVGCRPEVPGCAWWEGGGKSDVGWRGEGRVRTGRVEEASLCMRLPWALPHTTCAHALHRATEHCY